MTLSLVILKRLCTDATFTSPLYALIHNDHFYAFMARLSSRSALALADAAFFS